MEKFDVGDQVYARAASTSQFGVFHPLIATASGWYFYNPTEYPVETLDYGGPFETKRKAELAAFKAGFIDVGSFVPAEPPPVA